VILEGDEYDSAFFDKGPKFLHYRPEKVILTSVEFDHADIYRDLAHLKQSFQRLVEIIPPNGALLACGEYEAVREVCAPARCPVRFYGAGEPSAWQATNCRVKNGNSLFEPCYRGSSEGTVKVKLSGRHNIANALAVYALGRELGVEKEVLRDGLASFSGVKRRQELRGEVRGVIVIDDFAHHPTAVEETIAGVRGAYPGRRLWAIFEPRSNTSRRKIFAQEFPRSLAGADRVVVAGLYQPEKIPEHERLSPEEVVRDINRLCGDRRALFIEKTCDIPAYVSAEAKSGDLILVMSNGGFDAVQEKILRLLKEKNS
jgi:UDP-N-acetylmuramate: L-alanyl-gamma-D-glutamyl-meso-diaminopimelate ligase